MPWQCLAAEASPLAGLADAEKSYYEKVFDYTLDNIQPGQKYDWASYGGKGSISVAQPFVSKSGSSCRNYTEDFTVQGQHGNTTGIGCKRVGSNGWCKLKEGDALTCALEQPSYSVGGTSMSVPTVNTGNMTVGPIGSPNVNTTGVNTNVGASIGANNDKRGASKSGDAEAQDAATKITGTAGKAAGTVTGSAIQWFSNTFGR